MGLSAFSLKGNVAVVTGGSRGIGEEIAVAMAKSGADVAPVARSEDALEATADRIEDAGGTAHPCTLDVTDGASVEAMFDDVEASLGCVDVLVNNAGVNPFFGDARNLDMETWNKILGVNVTGAFRCSREFGRRIDDRDGTGSIVNVASVGGVVALPYQTPYTASKHALVGMTKSLAVEWTPEIRVNALAPGYVKTEFTKGVRENENIREDILESIPQNRFADPDEVAASAVYLASDAAGYVTGEVHVADGGIAAQ
ncbi:SDR family NAD(P)-dependent oxidoreductase [Natrinema halophilum]|uniref:SDR family NAD(P)-dependent oxidoreductase n=1 Tax=Natrinema halophilum TaxID=1699371 RepID=UPI001F162900|nr:glucose 1-dehydrogenase [Natrinema halophilum]UHQ96103.1 glucose 1-dehydrogenase [Natrinema halophilum]